MFRCLLPLDRILRYDSVVTITCGRIAIVGWRALCLGCNGKGCCLGCMVVEVVCGGE